MKKISMPLIIILLFASTCFAQQIFNVTGNTTNNNNICTCNSVFGKVCSCSQPTEVYGRCTFPSTGAISRLLKAQIKQKLITEQGCQNVSVRVKFARHVGNQIVLNSGNVNFTSAAHNPFSIQVTNIDLGCQIEVPVTITVRAKDALGNSINQTNTSKVNVRGYIR